eukprot:scaffold179366_cov41-Prasinocladus_malaysianus.AAC.2
MVTIMFTPGVEGIAASYRHVAVSPACDDILNAARRDSALRLAQLRLTAAVNGHKRTNPSRRTATRWRVAAAAPAGVAPSSAKGKTP